MTLKAVLFDFNGVIINDEAIHEELVNEIVLEQNLSINPQDYKEVCLGRSDRACLRDILERRGRVVRDGDLAQLIARKAQKYRQHLESLESLPIYPVENFIRQVKELGLTVGLVTGALRSEVEWILNLAGLRPYFSTLVTGDEIFTSKPDPYGYRLAVERLNRQIPTLNLQPQHCLVIEDTPAGIEAAKAAGMQVVGVANTYPFHMLQRQANWTVDRVSELDLAWVQAVFSGRSAPEPEREC